MTLSRALAAGLAGWLVAAAPLQGQGAAVDSLADRYWQLRDGAPAALRDIQRAAATVDVGTLDFAHRTVLAALQDAITVALATRACRADLLAVDPFDGPQIALPAQAATLPSATPQERARSLHQWRQVGIALDGYVRDLRAGLAAGYVAPRPLVEQVLAQVADLIAIPVDSNPLLPPAARPGAPHRDDRWGGQMRAEVADVIVPSFRRVLAFLREFYLPRAPEGSALAAAPDGAACYRARIRAFTSSDLGADSIHALGLAAVARERGELPDSVVRRLRDDQARRFHGPAELIVAAQGAVNRLASATAQLLDGSAPAPLVVAETPRERGALAPWVALAELDTSRVSRGALLVNTVHPGDFPWFALEAVVASQAFPGRAARQASLDRLPLPEFLRHGADGPGAEGWALYAAQLVAESGGYSSDPQRVGQRWLEQLAACRLVIDTGLNALGWSPDSAARYLQAAAGLTPAEAEAEVDRALAHPAAGLAGWFGEREILDLRDSARARLGTRYSAPALDSAVVAASALPLPLLRQSVLRWADSAASATTPSR